MRGGLWDGGGGVQVTMDVVKAFYSKLIDWDLRMYDPHTDTPARALKYDPAL